MKVTGYQNVKLTLTWVFASPIGRWLYRGTDKSLARPDRKNNRKVAIFRPTLSLLPRRPGWTDKPSDFFLSGLQKLEFGHCNFHPSWSG